MEPLLSELLQTIKQLSPPEKVQESDELQRAKRKLQEAGLELTPPAKRRQSQTLEPANASTDHPTPLPVRVEQTSAELIFSKPVTDKPLTLPTANTKEAMDKWLKAHQGQFSSQDEHYQLVHVHCCLPV